MTASRIGIGLAASIVLVACPTAAWANDALVPPENSAAAQYTEAFPTAGGNKDVTKNNAQRPPTAAKALGSGNAMRLEAHGAEGEEAAAVAAATAPRPAPERASGSRGAPRPGHSATTPGFSSGDAASGTLPRPDAKSRPAAEAAGSSRLGELASTATGGSGDGLLRLAIFGGALWAAAYVLLQRRRAD